MKTFSALVVLLLALVAIAAGLALRGAGQPAGAADEPATFIGLAWVDGAEPAKGTPVQALVGGTVCGQTTIDIGGLDSGLVLDGFIGRAFYRVEVASAGEKAGCGSAGAAVSFSVGGKEAEQTGQWKTGEEQVLHLTAGAQPAIFSGAVTIDHEPVERDTSIRAYVGDVLCGELKVAADTEPPLSEDDKYRHLAVLPATARAGCGTAGAEVRFMIGNSAAYQAASWTPGFHALDLWAMTDRIFGCPSANQWTIASWWGSPITADHTPIEEALATCGDGSIAAAYALDPETGTFLRHVAGRPDVSTLEHIGLYDGIIVLGSASAVPPALQGVPNIVPGALANCPLVGEWAISVPIRAYSAAEEAFATCENVAIAAAYALDPQTQTWSRYIAGRPNLTTLTSLNSMEGVLTLGAQTAP